MDLITMISALIGLVTVAINPAIAMIDPARARKGRSREKMREQRRPLPAT